MGCEKENLQIMDLEGDRNGPTGRFMPAGVKEGADLNFSSGEYILLKQ